jgi:Fuc2NAc and GlcNAc transferase
MTEARWLVSGMVATAFLLTVGGTWAFRALVTWQGVLATPNQRSLHRRPMPSGGGAVFAIVFLTMIGAYRLVVPSEPLPGLALLGGGAAAVLAGVADDRFRLAQPVKLLVYGLLAAWILACNGGRSLIDLPLTPRPVGIGLSWISLVWVMGLYNFMDGIDGMAASGGAFISGAMAVALQLAGVHSLLIPTACVLSGVCLGFLVFNWPPASIFMGDSGSLFLGYVFAALIESTIVQGQLSVWTWIIIFGYFAGDTTTTTVLRMISIRRFYEGHQSHAYQNLARILDSHLRVVRGVVLYHVIWLLPLAIWSVLQPTFAPLGALLALGPVVAWTWRFGPRLSSA